MLDTNIFWTKGQQEHAEDGKISHLISNEKEDAFSRRTGQQRPIDRTIYPLSISEMRWTFKGSEELHDKGTGIEVQGSKSSSVFSGSSMDTPVLYTWRCFYQYQILMYSQDHSWIMHWPFLIYFERDTTPEGWRSLLWTTHNCIQWIFHGYPRHAVFYTWRFVLISTKPLGNHKTIAELQGSYWQDSSFLSSRRAVM